MGVRGRAAGRTDLAARLGRAGSAAFVGRHAERELVAATLAGDPGAAVVFFHGPGGIGKTALLRRVVLDAEASGVTAVVVDGRAVTPSPDGLLAALAEELGLPAGEDPVPALHDLGRLLLVVDTFERCSGLQGWLRERLLPRLPADALTVVAGREPPESAWRFDPAWQGLLRVVALRNLPPDDATGLLAARGVPPPVREEALRFAGGHPLALCLVAETASASGVPVPAAGPGGPDLLRVLLERIVDEAPSPQHRAALEVCAHARVTTESLLRAALPEAEADELFRWLWGRSFVERAADGLHPHDLARDVLDAELRWRDPDRYADLHRRIRAHLLDRHRRNPLDGARTWRDLMFLHRRNPVFAPFLTWDVEDGVYPDTPGAADRAALLAMTRTAEGDESARVLAHWLDRRAGGCTVYRRAGEPGPVGFALHLRLSEPDPADLATDPVVAAAWAHVDATGPLRPGEQLDVLRTFVVPGSYQRPSPVMDRIQIDCAHGWTSPPGPALSFLVLADPGFWAPQMAYIDHHPAGQATVGGRPFTLFAHDWRAVPMAEWFGALAGLELAGDGRPAAPAVDPPQRTVLSAPEFAAAVRDALRSARRPGDLGRNPLCRSRVVTDAARGRAPAEALADLLVEATDSLAGDPRDARLHRAVATTFFRGVPTQEAAAERLGLPFSTYRRHLGSGIERITAWLWERELRGAGQGVSTGRPVG
ncbi:hypothetical protein [Geodermatophilus sp. SYSU D00710]